MMFKSFVCFLAAIIAGVVANLNTGTDQLFLGLRQHELGNGPSNSDAFNFTTLRLSNLSSSGNRAENTANDANEEDNSSSAFTTLAHPRFPAHQMRIKKTEFCDPTVNVYTGYLDVDYNTKHLFFYFFESRRNPDEDDVIMWINGGPGCSSSMGLLMELGPCSIDMTNSSSNGTTWNPYSWNNEANIFFLDQPVGVGFSYADYGMTVETTEDAAKNIHAFLTIFFETFDQFKGRKLHLAGESYGGRYLPTFASEIVDQNAIAKAEGRPTLNLASVLIGNGITDISTLYEGRFEVECGKASLDVPFQSIATCVRMKQALPRCNKAMKKSCVDTFDAIDCNAAINFCDNELSTGYWASGRNVYDISKMCTGSALCYAETTVIESFLNNASTRHTLGVLPLPSTTSSPHSPPIPNPNSNSNIGPGPFTSCSPLVGSLFRQHMDKYAHPAQLHISALLARDVRVLIYAGTYDWQCNWVANRLWVERMEWEGAGAFNAREWRDWVVGGGDGVDGVDGEEKKAGETKREGLLTFATIRGAGHMVPHDKPVEALAMVSRWIHEKEL